VAWWSEFLATDPEIRVWFPALPVFWKIVGLERGPLSLVSTIEELQGRNSSDSGLENLEYGHRIRHADLLTLSIRKKVSTNFADKRMSFGRYSSLADSGHGVFPLGSVMSYLSFTHF
jgi:hypothetical protein